IGRRLHDRAIQDRTLAKALVVLPNMLDRNSCLALQTLDDGACFISRSVVGNHDLKIPMALRSVAPDGFLKPPWLVVRAEDDGNAHGDATVRRILGRNDSVFGRFEPERFNGGNR